MKDKKLNLIFNDLRSEYLKNKNSSALQKDELIGLEKLAIKIKFLENEKKALKKEISILRVLLQERGKYE